MILGFDHLALSVENIDLEKYKLEEQGFNCVFLEKNVTNHIEKKNLLNYYKNSHDIGLFRKNKSSLAIEIIAHGKVTNLSQGSYYYHDNYIKLATNNLELEKIFWLNALGFLEKKDNLIEFASFIPNWSCKIKLDQVDESSPYYLDSLGYTCVALLTNNLKEDMLKITQFGANDMTKPFDIMINNQNLDIMMFRTPTGAICELVQIK